MTGYMAFLQFISEQGTVGCIRTRMYSSPSHIHRSLSADDSFALQCRHIEFHLTPLYSDPRHPIAAGQSDQGHCCPPLTRSFPLLVDSGQDPPRSRVTTSGRPTNYHNIHGVMI
jgi:hypothetical protein